MKCDWKLIGKHIRDLYIETTRCGDVLYPLRCLHGYLHEMRLAYKKNSKKYWNLALPIGKKCFIIGTPLHTNIGDNAIALAEFAFLEKYVEPNRIKEITTTEYEEIRMLLPYALCGKKTTVFWHGGGNMGDTWYNEECFRRRALKDFEGKPMFSFPQTLHYSDTELGKERKEESIPYYDGKENFTLVAREELSYALIRDLYPNTKSILVPDIVLSATMETFGVLPQNRDGVMLCMRNDTEKALSLEDEAAIKKTVQSLGVPYRLTDMHADCRVTKENRAECVRSKMMEFAKAQLVITDRLHGMVFSAITGTPCVVFSNYNHKVRGTYEWISYLPYIRYVESVEEMKACIPELLSMKDCRYDNTPLIPYYEKLAEVVKQKCR